MEGGRRGAFPLRAEKIFLVPLMGLGTLLNRLDAHYASITIFSVLKMVCGAHPKRHRLEACATNSQAGSLRYQFFADQGRRLLPPFSQKTENKLLDSRYDN